MNRHKSFRASTILGVLAVVSTFAVVWAGWWLLALSVVFAIGAAIFAPTEHHGVTPRAIRETLAGIRRRLRPHSWRPGN